MHYLSPLVLGTMLLFVSGLQVLQFPSLTTQLSSQQTARFAGQSGALRGSFKQRASTLEATDRIVQAALLAPEQAAPPPVDERTRIMRTVRRIHVSSTATEWPWYFRPEHVVAQLLKEAEFKSGTWQFVDTPTNADLVIELIRAPGWDFSYRITHPPSGLNFGTGTEPGWDDVTIAPYIAKKIIKDLRALMPPASAAATPSPSPPAKPSKPEAREESPRSSELPTPAAAPSSPPPTAPTGEATPDNLDAYRMRVDVQLVLVEAVVRGPGGSRPIGSLESLKREDFKVLEDSLPQTVRHFSRDQLPLAVALVLDASGSIAPYVTQLRQAARETLGLLKPGDRVALFQFTESVQRVVPLTADLPRVAERIENLDAGGGTNIFDALAEAIEYLHTAAPEGRRVIVLVSDNMPTVPASVSESQVLRSALEGETVIYSIKTPRGACPACPAPLWVSPLSGQPGAVENLAKETGGEVIDMERARSVSAALGEVVERLKTRYTLGYYPSNKARDGTFRVIQISLEEGFGTSLVDYIILARRGYYAQREAAP